MSLQPNMTFINLPVKDLNKAKGFFSNLGFTFNAQFTNETAACMVINEQTFAMLLTETRFKDFTNKDIVDASKNVEVLIGISANSRDQVDDIVNKAFDAGASFASDPKDYGFMYQKSFMDLDGHVWEAIYMDPEAVQ